MKQKKFTKEELDRFKEKAERTNEILKYTPKKEGKLIQVDFKLERLKKEAI